MDAEITITTANVGIIIVDLKQFCCNMLDA